MCNVFVHIPMRGFGLFLKWKWEKKNKDKLCNFLWCCYFRTMKNLYSFLWMKKVKENNFLFFYQNIKEYRKKFNTIKEAIVFWLNFPFSVMDISLTKDLSVFNFNKLTGCLLFVTLCQTILKRLKYNKYL